MIVNRILILMSLSVIVRTAAFPQSHEAAQLALNYEKLKQLEEILDNMYKGYRTLREGYGRIKNVAEGNHNLHQAFLDGLFQVSPGVAKYRRISEIIKYQQMLMQEHRRSSNRFKQDPNLTAEELKYIGNVYAYLINQSLRNLEELFMVITANKLRMNDDERIKAIDRIYSDLENKLSFLRYFHNSTQMLVLQREKEQKDVDAANRLFGLE